MTGTRNWRTACGRLKPFTVKAQVGSTWITYSTADALDRALNAAAKVLSTRPNRRDQILMGHGVDRRVLETFEAREAQ